MPALLQPLPVVLTMQKDRDLRVLRTEDLRVADERRCAKARVARARRLVANGAIRVEHLFAARGQLGDRERLRWIVLQRCHFLLLAVDPLRIVLGGHDVDDDRHEGVFGAAEFLALAAIRADLLGLEPGIAHEARNRVLLDPELRHRERMDHVVGRRDDTDLLVDGNDQRIVDVEEIRIAARMRGNAFAGEARHLARGRQGRHEADAFALALQVVIAPTPLETRGLDRQIGVGRVLHLHDQLRCRKRHQDDDDEGNDGPDDLDRRVLVPRLGLMAERLPMLEDGVEHHAEHGAEDHQTDQQHQRVQVVDVRRDPRHADRQVQLIHLRAAGRIAHGPRRCRRQGGRRGEQERQAASPQQACDEMDHVLNSPINRRASPAPLQPLQAAASSNH